MIFRRVLSVLLCLCTAALVACDSGNGVGALPILTRVRVINLIPNAPGITVTLDTDAPLVTNLGFQQLTQYLDAQPGTREFKVSVDGGATTLLDSKQALVTGSDFTFIAYGPVEAANSLLELDAKSPIPNGGTFFFRLIDLASIGPIDVYITPLGADLSVTGPVIARATFGGTTVFVSVPSGDLQLRVTPNGTKEVIYDSGTTVNFGDKAIVQAVAYGKGSGRLVNVAILNNDDQGTGQVVENRLAEFKLVNASSVSSPLNVFVDGVLALANVPFAGVSNYQKTDAGTRAISIQASATPGADLLTLSPNLEPATDTSIVVSGSAGALRALVLTDNNLPAAAGHARVRFVNASPDLASMDVYVNFVRVFSAVASNTASPYAELSAETTGTTYEFDFNVAGTTTPVLMMPNATIVAGKTYTVYVVGPAASLLGVLVGDN
jgi:uncharacterized protein DUF4397